MLAARDASTPLPSFKQLSAGEAKNALEETRENNLYAQND
jgi:hypothetical protein